MSRLDELLRAVRDEKDVEIPEDRIWTAIEQRLAQGPPAPPVSDAGVGATLTSGVSLKLIGGLVVLAGVGLLVPALISRTPAPEVAARSVEAVVTPAASPVPDQPAPAMVVMGPDPAEEVFGPVLPPVVLDPVASGPRPAKRSDERPRVTEPVAPSNAEALDDFRAELRLLESIEAAHKQGDYALVFRRAAEHERRFGARGQLVQERLIHTVEALCALGRVDDARQHANELLEKWPNSTHARRARTSCGGS